MKNLVYGGLGLVALAGSITYLASRNLPSKQTNITTPNQITESGIKAAQEVWDLAETIAMGEDGKMSPRELEGLLKGVGMQNVPKLNSNDQVRYQYFSSSKGESAIAVYINDNLIGKVNSRDVLAYNGKHIRGKP